MIRIAGAISLILCTGRVAFAGPLRLTDLPAAGTLDIHFVSVGCFHREERTIIIGRDPDPVADISPGAPRYGLGGRVRLSEEDIVGLDRLIAFWRTSPEGGCTTRNEVTLAWRIGPYEIEPEHFVDESCEAPESLWTLIRRTDDFANRAPAREGAP